MKNAKWLDRMVYNVHITNVTIFIVFLLLDCIYIGHSLNLWLSHLWNMYRHWNNYNVSQCNIVCCSFHFECATVRMFFCFLSFYSPLNLLVWSVVFSSWFYSLNVSCRDVNIVTDTNQLHTKKCKHFGRQNVICQFGDLLKLTDQSMNGFRENERENSQLNMNI